MHQEFPMIHLNSFTVSQPLPYHYKILKRLDHVSFMLSIPFSRHSDAAIKLASECASMGTAKFEVEVDASP